MNRRTALLAAVAMLATSVELSAHHISRKQRGEVCVGGSCSMCQHNSAHGRGLKHDADGWYDPRTRQRRPDTKELAEPEKGQTPQMIVDVMLAVIKPEAHDVLIDPGCGDGRFLISAARDYGCRAIGIEIDKRTSKNAQQFVYISGQGDRVAVLLADARHDPLIKVGTVVVLYLYDDLIRELWPRFANARAVASYKHRLPVAKQDKYTMRGETFYVWQRK